jgi:hypothetical protein
VATRKKVEAKCPVTRGEVDLDAYAELDGEWRKIGIAAPARRAIARLSQIMEAKGIRFR